MEIMEKAMRRQARPFIVEVKQKRTGQRKDRSIWGDVDLTAVAAETTMDTGKNELANRQFIDSDPLSPDVEGSDNLQAEHHMANPQEAETIETVIETPANAESIKPGKREPRQRKAKARSGRPVEKNTGRLAAKAAESPAAKMRTGRKIYSKQERAQKLGQIEKSVGRGESVKSAVRQAGISEQTYYQWKRASGSAASAGDLKDLLALEEENERLKKLLAERLSRENAELKKKLGLK